MEADFFKYFAYGSNMSTRRLRQPNRAPSAVAIAKGCVRGYRLTFDKVSADGSGKCDMEETGRDFDCVLGVLFEISRAEADALDRAEGLGHGYEKREIEVETLSGLVRASVYVATAKNKLLRPYDWYKAHVVAGAEEHSLDAAYLAFLRTVESIPDPIADRAARETLAGGDRCA